MMNPEEEDYFPEDMEEVKDQVLGKMIGLGLIAFDFTEEKLIAKLSALSTEEISKETLDIVKEILVEHEKYELANVVKTHLEYNYEDMD